MKLSLLVFLGLFSFATFATDELTCSGSAGADDIEVTFVNGDLSYNDGRNVDVTVSSASKVGKNVVIEGISRGLVFAGGGSQSVRLSVNLNTKKGKFVIKTNTFYSKRETTYKVTCSI